MTDRHQLKPPTTRWAVAALIFGIIGAALISVVCAAVALTKTRTGQFGGRGLAIAALILSGLWIVIGIVAVVLVLVMPGDSTTGGYAPAVGSCFASEPDGGFDKRDEVSCDQPHRVEVFAVFDVPGDDYPGAAVLKSYLDRCSNEIAQYAGAQQDLSGFDVEDARPSDETWAAGDRTVKCLAVADNAVTGSLQG